MGVTRDDLRTVAVKVESTPGTEEAGSWDSSDAGFKHYDVEFEPDQQFEERKPHSDSLGQEPAIPTLRSGNFRFRTELVGSGDHTASPPPFDVPLRGVGFKRHDNLDSIAVTSVTGIFKAGETITGNGESAVVAETLIGDGTLRVFGRTGDLGASITGSESGATGTAASATAIGIAYRLVSPKTGPMESLTLRHYNGSDGATGILDKLAAARGSLRLEADTNQTVRLIFNFLGKAVALGESAAQLASSAPSRIPPAFKSVGLGIDMGSTGTPYAPDFDTLQLDIGNELAMAKNSNDPTGAGYGITKIVDRNCSGSFNARFTTADEHPWYTHMIGGATGPLTFVVGTSAGNMFRIHLPLVQYKNLGRSRNESGVVDVNADFGFHKSPAGNDEIFILCL